MLPGQNHKSAMGRRGFTLIEIMTVIAIIVVLIGLTVAVGTGVKQGGQIRATKATLQNLQGMLDSYKSDYGAIPAGEWNSARNPKFNMFPTTWSPSIKYVKGDMAVVTVGTDLKIYQCYLDVPSAGTQPDTDSAHWTDGKSPNPPYNTSRNFLIAVQQDPKLNKQLTQMASVTKSKTYVFGGENKVMVDEVDDAFGNAIWYVAQGPSQSPFFLSPGPDGKDPEPTQYNKSPFVPLTGNTDNQDNIYSYDR